MRLLPRHWESLGRASSDKDFRGIPRWLRNSIGNTPVLPNMIYYFSGKTFRYKIIVSSDGNHLDYYRRKRKPHQRRRGTALVEMPQGILVVAGRKDVYSLPGGGCGKKEKREHAALRELEEETGLKGRSPKYLFSETSSPHKSHGGGYFQDNHKVFLIKADGSPRPRKEIKKVAFYKSGSSIRLGRTSRKIINRYYLHKTLRAPIRFLRAKLGMKGD